MIQLHVFGTTTIQTEEQLEKEIYTEITHLINKGVALTVEFIRASHKAKGLTKNKSFFTAVVTLDSDKYNFEFTYSGTTDKSMLKDFKSGKNDSFRKEICDNIFAVMPISFYNFMATGIYKHENSVEGNSIFHSHINLQPHA
jgi:hypothetical protein